MKKAGILTHYYKSNNFGGNLQAYALAERINRIPGYSAEQICYRTVVEKQRHKNEPQKSGSLLQNVREALYRFRKRISKIDPKKWPSVVANKCLARRFAIRNAVIREFNECNIPHSKKAYSQADIAECADRYDIFVTGSDQVWSGCSEVYSLNFVHGKTKLSYAASIARKEIPEEQKTFYRERLTDYSAISVRDETDLEIISELTEKPVEVVADPVFLLNRENWEEVAVSEVPIKGKYVFCYFLGDSRETKKRVRQFARRKHLKIVHIPHFRDNENVFTVDDLFFGNKKPYNVSPAGFLSLVQNAEYVFTDSFHAAAFSLIFRKQFFVFDRVSKWGVMNSRLLNLLSQYGCEERFCSGENRESLDYLQQLPPMEYGEAEKRMEAAKQVSEGYLFRALEAAPR